MPEATTLDDAKAPKASEFPESFMTEARKRFARAVDSVSTNRSQQLDDLKFAAGSPDNKWQWDDYALSNRAADPAAIRPALTINQLPQHINQITGDQRQNRPQCHVIPANNGDEEVAKMYDGYIRYVQVSSDADIAYDTACDAQVTHGEGFFRLVTEYCDNMSFDQDLKVKRVRNPFGVYMDPSIQDPVGADANWCFLVDDMTKDEFEARWPNADCVGWESGDRSADNALWYGNGTIRVAEYYYVEKTNRDIYLMPNGQVYDVLPEGWVAGMALKTRKAEFKKVKWCKMSGKEVLESTEWLGTRIPVYRVVGNEWLVEGQVVVSGIVRNAKDPQRMINYWTSQEAEMLALAPKAPFVGAAGAFEGYEKKWRQANTVAWPYLEYNPILEGEVMAPPPQRMPPPMPAAGIIEAKLQAIDALKQTTGQYDSSIGRASNETSGRAIIARERQSDTGTFHYIDNLSRAIRQMGRDVVEIAPKVLDTPRLLRILGEDGTPSLVGVDVNQQNAVTEREGPDGALVKFYNPKVGKYDITVVVGPSYSTKRVEAAENMGQLITAAPNLMDIVGDLWMKNSDFPGADEMAARLKKFIGKVNPELIDEEGKKQDDPRLMQAMQMVEALTQQMHEMQAMLEEAQSGVDAQKADNDHIKAMATVYDAETKRLQALAPALDAAAVQQIVIDTITGLLSTQALSEEAAEDEAEPAAGGAGAAMPPQPPISTAAPAAPTP